jgi:hypothetical protein
MVSEVKVDMAVVMFECMFVVAGIFPVCCFS